MAPNDPFETLLGELESRAMDDPALAEEWREALLHFSPLGPDPSVLLRFREWFLLENSTTALGAPPAVAWAPNSLDPDEPWARLLDSFFGIFQSTSGAEEGVLEDLWTGRPIRVESWPEMTRSPDDSLWVGRFILATPDLHEPLPGLLGLNSPGLVSAVSRDLVAIRAKASRARISQKECEKLFAPFTAASAPDAAGLSPETEITELLKDEKHWDLGRIGKVLEESGLEGLLEQLAFDTQVDLNRMQLLLPSMGRGTDDSSPTSTDPIEAKDRVPLEKIQDALETFDKEREDGTSLEDAFGGLEAALGLAPGTTEVVLPEDDSPPQGPEDSVDFDHWLEAYAWERGQDGSAPDEIEMDSIRSLLAGKDALSAADTLAWAMESETPAHLEARLALIQPFLHWANQEQEAGLESFLDGLRGDLGQRIGRILEFHQLIEMPGRHGGEVVSRDPLKIRTDDGEECLAHMPAVPWDDLPRLGDLLLGKFNHEVLEVQGILPVEARPAPPGEGTT
jgi:hypothetical protein